jgi:hypothetical protein
MRPITLPVVCCARAGTPASTSTATRKILVKVAMEAPLEL